MQNRTNRNLLFSSRVTSGVDTAALSSEANTLEVDNQRAVEQLRGSAGTIKELAIHIDTDVTNQNRMLDRVDKRFDHSNSLLSQTSQLLNQMVSDRTSIRICTLIAAFFVGLLVLYYLFKL